DTTSNRQECIHSLDEEEERPHEQPKQEQRAKILAHLTLDTSHIIGRNDWLLGMLSHLSPTPTSRKKVIVIQAALGAGKTSCLRLLHSRLLADSTATIFHECKPVDLESSGKEKTPVEHLDILLAHILNDLQPQQAERHEAPSLVKRTQLVLAAIGEVP